MIPLFIPLYSRTEMVHQTVESARHRPEISEIHILSTAPESVDTKQVANELDVYHHDIVDDGFAHDAHRAAPEISKSEFYLMADSDEEIIGDVSHMVDAIKSEDDVGAVGSPLVEDDRIFYMAGNFREADGGVYREAVDMPDIRTVDGIPFAEFDFISTCAVYRKSCLEDYTWDDRYRMGLAQDDFHLGHWKYTDWTFLCSFIPVYRHNTGGRENLQNKRQMRNDYSYQQFCEKWEYDFWNTKSPWMSSNYEPRDDYERAAWHLREGGPVQLLKRGVKKVL